MKILRFIFPFLFIRNWQSGAWELSRSRLFVVLAGTFLFLLGLAIAHMLQAPVVYTS